MGRTVSPGRVPPAAAEAGFTLLELLIAVAVLAVLAVAAMLALPASLPAPARDAALLRARHAAQQEAAILSGHPRGLMLDRRGLTLAWLAPPEGTAMLRWQRGTLQPWAGTAQPALPPGAGGATQDAPDLLFLPDGSSTPYQIRFRAGTEGRSCQSDGWNGVQCAAE